MFFAEAPKTSVTYDLAAEFVNALLRVRLLDRMPDVVSWAAELARIKTPLQRLTRVLRWYIAHITERYVPRATTARLFRLKFEQIEAAMTATKTDTVTVSEQTTRVVDRLANEHSWPPELLTHLPSIVQRSDTALTRFLARIRAATDLSEREQLFIEHILSTYLNTGWFVEYCWMPYWADAVGWQEHWRGRSIELVFDPRGESFLTGLWRVWANDWCRNPEAFDGLLERLNQE